MWCNWLTRNRVAYQSVTSHRLCDVTARNRVAYQSVTSHRLCDVTDWQGTVLLVSQVTSHSLCDVTDCKEPCCLSVSYITHPVWCNWLIRNTERRSSPSSSSDAPLVVNVSCGLPFSSQNSALLQVFSILKHVADWATDYLLTYLLEYVCQQHNLT